MELDLEKIKEESIRIRKQYPDRVPIIVDCHKKQFVLAKNKYLVPKDLKLSQFNYVLRKRCSISPDEGLYIMIKNTIPPSTSTISELDHLYSNTCGMLLMTLCKENVFGKK